MIVGIDGYFLIKPRGLGRYVQELLYALGRYADNDFEFIVIVPESVPADQYIMPKRIQYKVVKTAPFPIWEQFLLPRIFDALDIDVAHYPYNTMPLLFGRKKMKRVVTIHDLIFMNDIHGRGGSWYQNIGNKYRSIVVRQYKPGAQVIVTDSKRSSDDIRAKLGLTSEIVYIATEYSCRTLTDQNSPAPVKLNSKYMLHVGGISPHKNTERCIEAFLKASLKDTLLVVLGLGSDTSIANKFASENVIFPGWVSETEMTSYFYHASAVLFPSIIEGYGLPIVEAFNLGVPVITSDLDPMREIAGEGALLVDPYSIDSMSKAICQVVDEKTVKTLIEASKTRLLVINGKNMSDRMLSIYRRAVTSGGIL